MRLFRHSKLKPSAPADRYRSAAQLRGDAPASRRWWTLAFGCSLTLHLWLAVYLIMTGPAIEVMAMSEELDSTYERARQWAELAPQPREPASHRVSMRFVPPSPPEDLANAGEVDPTSTSSEEALEQMAERQQDRIEDMDEAERLSELRQRTQQLNDMNDEAVQGAVGKVESILGVPDVGDRALAPRQDAQGKFDTATMVLYDIVKDKNDEGQTVYRHIWVDAEGRSWSHDRKPSEMSSSDLRMAEIYRMVRENPSLRPLLESVLKMDASRNAKPR